MDQEEIRSQLRRRSELYSFEAFLNKGHRESGAHVHPSISSEEFVVTNFVRNENGELRPVKRTLGRERI